MPRLPARFAAIILSFAPLFRYRSWQHAEVLLIGAILAPSKRTVTSLLRIMGLSRERRFVNYHRVLNRARWSERGAARLLLRLLLAAFVPSGPVVLGLDDMIERRRGKRITAKGIYRDPVRSSHAHLVKASGLRWLSLMLLAPIPWAGRIWALPFLTTLAPSQRYCQEHRKPHKTLTDWARQMVLQARRWLPQRELVLVADSTFAALDLLAALARQGVICVTRLRLDAALYEPAPPRHPGTKGRPRTKGQRLPNLADLLAAATTRWQRISVPGWYGPGARIVEFCSATAVWRHAGLPVVPIRWVLLRDPQGRFDPQALLCTEPAREPLQIVRWFIQRWQGRSPSARSATTLASKRSASGQTARLPAPRPACSGSSRSSPYWWLSSGVTPVSRFRRRAGIASPVPPSSTPWPPCADRFGERAVSSCPSARMKHRNCRLLSSSA
jgi:DDE superfamily endonuclease